MNGTPMTNAQIEWAWDKWNEGYTLQNIADVLGKNSRTVQRRMSELQDERGCRRCKQRVKGLAKL